MVASKHNEVVESRQWLVFIGIPEPEFSEEYGVVDNYEFDLY